MKKCIFKYDVFQGKNRIELLFNMLRGILKFIFKRHTYEYDFTAELNFPEGISIIIIFKSNQ
jgi:hypothetical protein